MALIHELGHAFDYDTDPTMFEARVLTPTNNLYGDLEEQYNIIEHEDPIAGELGEGTRHNHIADGYAVGSPISR